MNSIDSTQPTPASELQKLFVELESELLKPNATRIRRTLSWLSKAQALHKQDDFDGAFLFFWISFNAMYAIQRPISNSEPDLRLMRNFFQKLLKFDIDKTIYNILWSRFQDSIRTLVKNEFVFSKYWEFTLGEDHEVDWEVELRKSELKLQASLPLADRANVILEIVFDRLYTLRNQLIHGSATYHGSINRQQVIDGSNILHFLVPQFVSILLHHPNAHWGEVMYPPIDRS